MLLLVLAAREPSKIYEWQSLKQMKKCISINVKLKSSFDSLVPPLRSTLLRWNAKQVYIELKQEYEWQNSKNIKTQ